MIVKLFKVFFITGTVFSLSLVIVFTASYFHYMDVVDKKIADEMLVDFVYYAERGLYLWTVFNFIEIMILLAVLFIYKTFLWICVIQWKIHIYNYKSFYVVLFFQKISSIISWILHISIHFDLLMAERIMQFQPNFYVL